MKLSKYLIVMFFLLYLVCHNSNAQSLERPNNIDSKDLYWKSKLEYAFMQTFSSSHEFAACQVFQKLDYDLAEINQIRRVTPFPASLTVEFEDVKEEILSNKDSDLATDTRVLKFTNLKVICDKVHYFDMVMERVTFGFPDSYIELDYLDKGRLKFVKASKIVLDIKVSENDILEILKLYPKAKALSSVKVTMKPNHCSSRGRVKLGILIAEFKLNGHLNQLSPKTINFVCDKLTINGIPQPRAFIKTIMGYINPVYDSTKLWLNLNVNKMNIVKGFVETNATIEKKGLKNAN